MRLSVDRHDLRLEFADETRREVSIFLRFANVGFGTAEALAARFYLPPRTLVSTATIRLDHISGDGELLELPFASDDDGSVRCAIDKPIAPGDEALVILSVQVPERLDAADLSVLADLVRPNGESVLDEVTATLHVEADAIVDESLSAALVDGVLAITRRFENKSRVPLPMKLSGLHLPKAWRLLDTEVVRPEDTVDAGDERVFVERYQMDGTPMSLAGLKGFLAAAAPWIAPESISATIAAEPIGFADVTCLVAEPALNASEVRALEVSGTALGTMTDAVLTIDLPVELAFVPGSRTFEGRPINGGPPARGRAAKNGSTKGTLELAVPSIPPGPFRLGVSVIALPSVGIAEVSPAPIDLTLVGAGQTWTQHLELAVRRRSIINVTSSLDKAPVLPVGGVLPFAIFVANAGTLDQPVTIEIVLDDTLELQGLEGVQSEELRSTRQRRHRLSVKLDGQAPRELTAALRMSPDAHEGDLAAIEIAWMTGDAPRIVAASETVRASAAPMLKLTSRLSTKNARPGGRVSLHLRVENGGVGVAEASRLDLSLPSLISVERRYGLGSEGEIPALAPGAAFEAAVDLRLHAHRPGAMSHALYSRLMLDNRDVAVVRDQLESSAIVSWESIAFNIEPLSSSTREVLAGDSLLLTFSATNGGDAIATRALVGLVGETEFELVGDAWVNDVRLDDALATELAAARGSVALEDVGPGERIELRMTIAARADRSATRTVVPRIALVSSGERIVREVDELTIATPARFRRQGEAVVIPATASATVPVAAPPSPAVASATTDAAAAAVDAAASTDAHAQVEPEPNAQTETVAPVVPPVVENAGADERSDDEADDDDAEAPELLPAAAVTTEMSTVAPFLRLRLQSPPSDAVLPLLDSLLSATSRGIYRHTLAARFLIADSVDFGGAETIAQRRAILASLEILRDAVTAGPVTIYKIVPLSDVEFVPTEDYVVGLEDANLRTSVERLLGSAIEALTPMTASVDQPYGTFEVRLDQREIERILADLKAAPIGAPAIARAIASMIPGDTAPGSLPGALHDYRVLLRQSLEGLTSHTDLLADASDELETALALVVEHIREFAAARANR